MMADDDRGVSHSSCGTPSVGSRPCRSHRTSAHPDTGAHARPAASRRPDPWCSRRRSSTSSSQTATDAMAELSERLQGESLWVSKGFLAKVHGCEVRHLAPDDFAWKPVHRRRFRRPQGHRAVAELARRAAPGRRGRRSVGPSGRPGRRSRCVRRRPQRRRLGRAAQPGDRPHHQVPAGLPAAAAVVATGARGRRRSGDRRAPSSSPARWTSWSASPPGARAAC